jgi:hypothetical protein
MSADFEALRWFVLPAACLADGWAPTGPVPAARAGQARPD